MERSLTPQGSQGSGGSGSPTPSAASGGARDRSSSTSNQARAPADRRPKQRRNKPTLNCAICVERKTKCDRGRPSCLTCIRRQTTCRYSRHADILVATQPFISEAYRKPASGGGDGGARAGRSNNPSSSSPPALQAQPSQYEVSPSAFPGMSPQNPGGGELPMHPKVFGTQPKHPFHNYWTSAGGMPEVVSVLPKKEHADYLVQKYFEVIDPIYPIAWRPDFEREYECFWNLPLKEKYNYNPSELALQFVIYACGTQFTESIAPEERENTAEFYLSASHQSLCLFSYLNRLSLPAIRTMVLMCYFMISNNHVSDGWNFSGVTTRQAHGLKLNRNPEIVTPNLSFQQKQQRCRLWMATLFQDTSLSLFLELPPTTIYHDVGPDSLMYADELHNMMSTGEESVSDLVSKLGECPSYSNDIAYMRSVWEYSLFIQQHICGSRSLNQPMFQNPLSKAHVISLFRDMYSSWRPPFNSWDSSRFDNPDSRLLRQLISVSANFFFVLTIMYVSEHESGGVTCDILGALQASHEGMLAFFALVRLCPAHVDMWGAYHTRGFSQAMMIGRLLESQSTAPVAPLDRDPRFMLAKSDLDRYLDILMRAKGTSDYEQIQQERVNELRAVRDRITVA